MSNRPAAVLRHRQAKTGRPNRRLIQSLDAISKRAGEAAVAMQTFGERIEATFSSKRKGHSEDYFADWLESQDPGPSWDKPNAPRDIKTDPARELNP